MTRVVESAEDLVARLRVFAQVGQYVVKGGEMLEVIAVRGIDPPEPHAALKVLDVADELPGSLYDEKIAGVWVALREFEGAEVVGGR